MTYEEFQQRNRRIAEMLQQIAERTGQMAWAGAAHPNNPTFNMLLAAQDELFKAAEATLREYQAGTGK